MFNDHSKRGCSRPALFLLIASVAGFIIVPDHAPGVEQVGRDRFGNCQAIGETGNTCHYVAPWLAHTLYDALKIATWGAFS